MYHEVPEPTAEGLILPDSLAEVFNLRWREQCELGLLSWRADRTWPTELAHRYVRLADVGKLLQESVQGQGRADFTWVNLLATGYVAVGYNASHKVCVHTQGPRSAVYNVRRGGHIDVRTPHLAWVGIWRKDNSLAKTMLLCAKTSIVGLGTEVQVWPFSNVFQGGKICWGNVSPALTPENFYAIREAFLGSEFNTDLWWATEECRELLHGGDWDGETEVDLGDYLPRSADKRQLREWITCEED
jgi:hypothetical protein